MEACHFYALVNLAKSTFLKQVWFNRSTFREARFYSMTVEQSAFFREVHFMRAANFWNAHIGHTLVCSQARFTDLCADPTADSYDAATCAQPIYNDESFANFEYMTADVAAYFVGTHFDIPTRFRQVTVRGDFIADSIQFGTRDTVDFSASAIAGPLSLRAAIFRGPVRIHQATLHSLILAGGDQALDLPALELTHTQINHDVQINHTVLGLGMIRNLRVGGTTVWDSVTFQKATVEYSDLGGLEMRRMDWPTVSDSLIFRGNSIQYIDADYNEMYALASSAQYNATLYQSLGEILAQQGDTRGREALFIDQYWRVWDEKSTLGSPQWFWTLGLGVLVEFGYSPERAFVGVLLFLVFGTLLFRNPLRMQPVGINHEGMPPFHPFWYSLDLMLPFVDLNIARTWQPRSERRWVWYYSYIHILMGWILIPVGLAAFAGILE